MAKFTVGQKVRIKPFVDAAAVSKCVLGAETRILAIASTPLFALHYNPPEPCWYELDIRGADGKTTVASETALEPLTPPNISQWADEKVKQVTKPEPIVPAPEKVKAA